MTRREFLVSSAMVAAFKDESLDMLGKLTSRFGAEAHDEDFWMQVRQGFTLDPNLVNLNNGGVCPSPRIVNDALRRQIEYSNQAPSFYMWRQLEPEIESVRARLASMFGVDKEEIAITRNASEALETCLFGFDLKPGDEILTTNMDYPRMITTIKQRERREGIKLVQVAQPERPNSHRELLDNFRQGITERTRLILVSQVSFLNGQIYPVKEVCRLGQERGIPVIVDGAHAFAQFPIDHANLGCEYYGSSLHKWLMAPIGTGMLYVKRQKIGGLWPLMAGSVEQKDDIRKFEEIGTHPAANHNAIGEAITFNEMIGLKRKQERLLFLRRSWTEHLSNEKKIRFHTNLERDHSCGLTTVEIAGIEPDKLAGWLLDKHNVFVTTIGHEQFKGIRVTANVYTSLDDINRFRTAMLQACRQGIG